jgi:hypothetical protein
VSAALQLRPGRVIYVHGIKPKPEPALHLAVLRECLLAGIARADPGTAAALADHPAWLELVAWSDLFYPVWRDLAADRPGIERLLATPAPGRDSIAAVLGARHWLASEAHRLGDRHPVLIRWLAGAATRASLVEALRYFADRDGASTRARARLKVALAAAAADGVRVLLVGHSLGSVIAFDTLWELTRAGDAAARIDHFLTLGSPLGAHYVRTRLLGARERGAARYPDGIGYWSNLAAIGDLAVLGRRFAAEFADMAALGRVGGIGDRLDLINPFTGADGLNVHRCYGYHVNRVTGAVIAGWWRGAPPAAALSPPAA